MLTKIKTSKVPDGYELFFDHSVEPRKMIVSHVRGGSILNFNTLTELRLWANEVEDLRAMQNGELTFREKLMAQYPFVHESEQRHIHKALEAHYDKRHVI